MSAVVLIHEAFKDCRKFTGDSRKANAITDKIKDYLLLDDQPFFPCFFRFCQITAFWEPPYTHPTLFYLQRHSALYDVVATNIHILIDIKVSKVSPQTYGLLTSVQWECSLFVLCCHDSDTAKMATAGCHWALQASETYCMCDVTEIMSIFIQSKGQYIKTI